MKKVEVKAKHIKTGKQGSCSQCMMSLAVNEVLKEGYHCRTYIRTFAICRNDQYGMLVENNLPGTVCDAVAAFDKSKKSVKPFVTRLDIPKEYLK